jgi:hypothetical protein
LLFPVLGLSCDPSALPSGSSICVYAYMDKACICQLSVQIWTLYSLIPLTYWFCFQVCHIRHH